MLHWCYNQLLFQCPPCHNYHQVIQGRMQHCHSDVENNTIPFQTHHMRSWEIVYTSLLLPWIIIEHMLNPVTMVNIPVNNHYPNMVSNKTILTCNIYHQEIENSQFTKSRPHLLMFSLFRATFAAMATLLKKQKPPGHVASAWWPGGLQQ